MIGTMLLMGCALACLIGMGFFLYSFLFVSAKASRAVPAILLLLAAVGFLLWAGVHFIVAGPCLLIFLAAIVAAKMTKGLIRGVSLVVALMALFGFFFGGIPTSPKDFSGKSGQVSAEMSLAWQDGQGGARLKAAYDRGISSRNVWDVAREIQLMLGLRMHYDTPSSRKGFDESLYAVIKRGADLIAGLRQDQRGKGVKELSSQIVDGLEQLSCSTVEIEAWKAYAAGDPSTSNMLPGIPGLPEIPTPTPISTP